MGDFVNSMMRRVNSVLINAMLSNKFGRKIFASIAENYLAGHSIEDGIKAVDEFSNQRRYSTVDILGEAALTLDQADRYMDSYFKIIDHVDNLGHFGVSRATISVKPTAICAVNDDLTKVKEETPLFERLENILGYAKERNLNVTLDMEDRHWTDISLDTAAKLWDIGYDNLGIVLQSRLHRTGKDIEDFLKDTDYKIPKEKIRVRACIGIYNEPKEFAVTSKKKAKKKVNQKN